MRWDENYDGYDGRVSMIQGGGHHNSSLKQDVEVLKSVFLLMMYGNPPPLGGCEGKCLYDEHV
jgi:hypothetical protein